MSTLTSGTYDPAFQPVVDAFDAHLRTTPYGGAALSVLHQGRSVIDVWGGIADVGAGRAWDQRTAAVLYSCTKSVTAIVVLRLVERGLLDLDATVAEYWPQFARHGKERVTVRELMAHRAGVPLVDASLTTEQILEGIPFAQAMADQKPLFEPGTAHAYHALSVGAGLGEIVRRVTGESLGAFLRDDLTGPLGMDLWIGLPEEEQDRVALVLPQDPTAVSREMLDLVRMLIAEDDRAWRCLSVNGALPIPLPGVTLENSYNRPEVRAAELPAANGVGTARSLAQLHAALVGPIAESGPGAAPLLSEATLVDATHPMSAGEPAFGGTGGPAPVWAAGFMLPWELRPMLGDTSFGHDGAAGALCFADREHQVGFAFVPSVMAPIAPDTRVNPMVLALRDCLDVGEGD